MALASLGPHIINHVSPHKSNLRKWQPRGVTILDPSLEDVEIMEEVCPSTLIVGRIYIPDSEVSERISGDRERFASETHERIMDSGFAGRVHFWQIVNEVHQDYNGIAFLNEFEMDRMRLADKGKYGCAIGGFSVGNPDMPEHDRMALWRRFYPAMHHAHKTKRHALAIHQYGKPDLRHPDLDWFALRYERQVQPRLPVDLCMLKTLVVEFGIDGKIWSDDGKARGFMEYTDAPGYVNQLTAFAKEFEEYDSFIACRNIFTLGHNPPWSTYDIDGQVSDMLAAYAASSPPPVAPPKPPDVPVLPPVDREIADSFNAANLRLVDSERHMVAKFWTTQDGRWVTSRDNIWAPPAWAIKQYKRPQFHDSGAATHLFVRVEDENGKPVSAKVRFFVPGGPQYETTTEEGRDYWANMFMTGSSAYWPGDGQSGPWHITLVDDPQVELVGAGLPNKYHISSFLVIRMRSAQKPPQPPQPPQPPEPPEPPEVYLPNVLSWPIRDKDIRSKFSQFFGDRYDYYMETYGIPGHNGLDIAVPFNTNILSPADGIVEYVGHDAGYGYYIRILHDELDAYSFFAHMVDRPPFSWGERVVRGQPVGNVGSTGNSTGPHLHWEIRLAIPGKKDYAISPYAGHTKGRTNPLAWMDAQFRIVRGTK